MKAVFELIRRAFRHEAPLHPVERQLAKKWIKQRLVVVFPYLRNNPQELEKAYRTLGLEPREGREFGEDETVFEVKLPGDLPEA